jgi:hypothetical protein
MIVSAKPEIFSMHAFPGHGENIETNRMPPETVLLPLELTARIV